MDRGVTDRFSVVYTIEANSYAEAKEKAFGVQVEQTIEFPYELVEDSRIKRNIVGELETLTQTGESQYDAQISYPSDLVAGEVTQFMNVVFGNSSLQPGIWVKDIKLSPSLWSLFKGPRVGLAGLRKLLNVPKRPLLQAVIKPVGSTVQTLSDMCRAYAEGGVDVIKDDHGITNQSYAPFEERIKYCVEAVAEGKAKSGSRTLYAANVTADGEETIARAYKAKELGADALMVAPGMIGFGMLHRLATEEQLGLPIISHPALTGGFTMPGVSGISMGVWFGVLNRLCGADMPIFVSYGGRFTFSKETCQDIVKRLLDTSLPIKQACPSPGGGVTEKRIPELMKIYGHDTMFLVGGDMFRRGHDLVDNAKTFIELLETGANFSSPT